MLNIVFFTVKKIKTKTSIRQHLRIKKIWNLKNIFKKVNKQDELNRDLEGIWWWRTKQ